MAKRQKAKDNLRSEIPEKMTVLEYREFLKTGKFTQYITTLFYCKTVCCVNWKTLYLNFAKTQYFARKCLVQRRCISVRTGSCVHPGYPGDSLVNFFHWTPESTKYTVLRTHQCKSNTNQWPLSSLSHKCLIISLKCKRSLFIGCC